mmetsp:Transcript_43451/g.125421  ORF Transcript_43451/g.125421 Transcript_43451/m.125421 type:complete len:680 (-) Transcript_43451:439-2478(-)
MPVAAVAPLSRRRHAMWRPGHPWLLRRSHLPSPQQHRLQLPLPQQQPQKQQRSRASSSAEAASPQLEGQKQKPPRKLTGAAKRAHESRLARQQGHGMDPEVARTAQLLREIARKAGIAGNVSKRAKKMAKENELFASGGLEEQDSAAARDGETQPSQTPKPPKPPKPRGKARPRRRPEPSEKPEAKASRPPKTNKRKQPLRPWKRRKQPVPEPAPDNFWLGAEGRPRPVKVGAEDTPEAAAKGAADPEPAADPEGEADDAAQGKDAVSQQEPKKPQNAFWTWFRENRKLLTVESGMKSGPNLGKWAGQKWTSLSAEQKAPYIERGRQSRDNYRMAVEEFLAKGGKLRPSSLCGRKAWLLQAASSSSSGDSKAPRRPQNAYWLWLHACRSALSAELGTNRATMLNKVGGQRWKAMTMEQQRPWREESQQRQAAYKQARHEWLLAHRPGQPAASEVSEARAQKRARWKAEWKAKKARLGQAAARRPTAPKRPRSRKAEPAAAQAQAPAFSSATGLPVRAPSAKPSRAKASRAPAPRAKSSRARGTRAGPLADPGSDSVPFDVVVIDSDAEQQAAAREDGGPEEEEEEEEAEEEEEGEASAAKSAAGKKQGTPEKAATKTEAKKPSVEEEEDEEEEESEEDEGEEEEDDDEPPAKKQKVGKDGGKSKGKGDKGKGKGKGKSK